MHELSIAEALVSTAVEAIRSRADAAPGELAGLEVAEVHLRLGALAGVEREALLFCYDIATADTPLAGSRLAIEELAVVISCDSCGGEVALPGIQDFRCPRCGRPSLDIRQGRELELASIHFVDRPPAPPSE
ncbi:hydrogenase nickel incorporation protein [Aquisphaera giovannonii]|uniref:Hydrogenase maturation factor HypA n=1 Tax=Aquisphaera giovannonii TaxID=406548 RepID=A0A5B9W499_9BACT|nr:hydrogenase maturation nickel metallochaperone HypA [Aquisphaera giovannonii]QEH34800.1 hydrogenase nickel incorporation protein [Aquisphaera giovannonii]